MKFISTKTIVDHANELHDLKQQKAALLAQIKELNAQIEPLEAFVLKRAKGVDFQFNGDDGYLKEVVFAEHSREDVNDDAVRRIFARLGKKVPMKTSEWTTVRVRYAKETDE
jgi:hypothetical protein